MYLNILEEEATELMLEECTFNSHDKLQLAVKVFYAQFGLTKVTRPLTISLSNHINGYK